MFPLTLHFWFEIHRWRAQLRVRCVNWHTRHRPAGPMRMRRKLHSRKWKERQHKRQRRVSCLFPVSERTNQQAAFFKMSGFDSNPFAEPTGDNPFNVSVWFYRFNSYWGTVEPGCWHIIRVKVASTPGNLLGGCRGGIYCCYLGLSLVEKAWFAVSKPISGLCLQRRRGILREYLQEVKL